MSNTIGVDIGGTKVAAGLVDSRGEVLRRAEFPMYVTGSAEQAMNCVHSAIRAVLDGMPGGVAAIGVASPGPLGLPEGVVISSPNLPCWRNFRLGDAIRAEYGIPTVVDNDANAAGLAEALWGAGAEYDSVFCATIGTGIGTAFVLHKQLYYGHTAIAPEGGHMTIDINAPCHCECGKRGCLEGMASGPSMVRRTRARIAANGNFNTELWGTDPCQITTRMIAAAWRAGDPLATDILRETADLYAVWLGNVIDLLEPAAIVIGGGLSALFSEWFEHISKKLPECSIVPNAWQTPLLRAKFGSDAGIVGAAALCQRKSAVSSATHHGG
ncbi:MAG TPA: ROK family protein [Terriglobales bacterium]|nr:ROK family protein [Terriglobales bacterium]